MLESTQVKNDRQPTTRSTPGLTAFVRFADRARIAQLENKPQSKLKVPERVRGTDAGQMVANLWTVSG